MSTFMSEKSRLKLDVWSLDEVWHSKHSAHMSRSNRQGNVVDVQVPTGTALASKFGCTVHIADVGKVRDAQVAGGTQGTRCLTPSALSSLA